MDILPEYLYASVLSEWVPFGNFGKFDSAVCNKKERKLFLDIIGKEYFVLKDNTCWNGILALKWIEMRRIHFRKLNVGVEISNLKIFKFKICPSKIETIVFNSTVSLESISEFLMTCSNIRNLKVMGFEPPLKNFVNYFEIRNLDFLEVWIDRLYYSEVPTIDPSKMKCFSCSLEVTSSYVSLWQRYLFYKTTNIDFDIENDIKSLVDKKSDSLLMQLYFVAEDNMRINFSTIVYLIKNCYMSDLIVSSPGGLINIFTYWTDCNRGESHNFHIINTNKGIIFTLENMLEFVTLIKNCGQITIENFPLNNEIIKIMIINNPKRHKHWKPEFINCGIDYDLSMVDRWSIL
jgi:hypothetical protein